MDQHFCTACGHRLGSDDLFCTGCGARVASAAEPPADPTDDTRERTAVRPSMLDQLLTQPADATAVRRAVPPAPARTRRSRGRFWGWVAAAAVVVAAVSYGLGMLADHGSQPTATPGTSTPSAGGGSGASSAASSPSASPLDPQGLAQAKALHALLERSAVDKQKIAVAASELETCHHLDQAVQTFQDAASSRDRLVDQAAGLEVGLLPGGGAAVASFSDALRAAADADRAYVDWGEARHKVHHRCRGGKPLQGRAVGLSSASHAPKQQTAQAWNVIATQFGLPPITWSSL